MPRAAFVIAAAPPPTTEPVPEVDPVPVEVPVPPTGPFTEPELVPPLIGPLNPAPEVEGGTAVEGEVDVLEELKIGGLRPLLNIEELPATFNGPLRPFDPIPVLLVAADAPGADTPAVTKMRAEINDNLAFCVRVPLTYAGKCNAPMTPDFC